MDEPRRVRRGRPNPSSECAGARIGHGASRGSRELDWHGRTDKSGRTFVLGNSKASLSWSPWMRSKSAMCGHRPAPSVDRRHAPWPSSDLIRGLTRPSRRSLRGQRSGEGLVSRESGINRWKVSIRGRKKIWNSFRKIWISFHPAWISFRPAWISYRPAWKSFRVAWRVRRAPALRSRRERGGSFRGGERLRGTRPRGRRANSRRARRVAPSGNWYN